MYRIELTLHPRCIGTGGVHYLKDFALQNLRTRLRIRSGSYTQTRKSLSSGKIALTFLNISVVHSALGRPRLRMISGLFMERSGSKANCLTRQNTGRRANLPRNSSCCSRSKALSFGACIESSSVSFEIRLQWACGMPKILRRHRA